MGVLMHPAIGLAVLCRKLSVFSRSDSNILHVVQVPQIFARVFIDISLCLQFHEPPTKSPSWILNWSIFEPNMPLFSGENILISRIAHSCMYSIKVKTFLKPLNKPCHPSEDWSTYCSYIATPPLVANVFLILRNLFLFKFPLWHLWFLSLKKVFRTTNANDNYTGNIVNSGEFILSC